MPIRPADRARYPKDWRVIVARVRRRSGNRCECKGECDIPHAGSTSRPRAGRYRERHGRKALYFSGKVILSTAHLDHRPETRSLRKLKHMCQRCHLRYDRHHHAANARATREAKSPQLVLLGVLQSPA